MTNKADNPDYTLRIGKYECYPHNLPNVRPIGALLLVQFMLPDGLHSVFTTERVESIVSIEANMRLQEELRQAQEPPRIVIPNAEVKVQ